VQRAVCNTKVERDEFEEYARRNEVDVLLRKLWGNRDVYQNFSGSYYETVMQMLLADAVSAVSREAENQILHIANPKIDIGFATEVDNLLLFYRKTNLVRMLRYLGKDDGVDVKCKVTGND